MKSRLTLVALLTLGIFASSTALAQHGGHHPPPPPPPYQHVDHHHGPRVVHIDHRNNWRKGRALSRKVAYRTVAPERIHAYALRPAPRGHRYVRVGRDILLIAIGTRLVVDAYQVR
jgi:Ni/Co efflux regulator RcnB